MESATATISPSGDAVRIQIAADPNQSTESVAPPMDPPIVTPPQIDIFPLASVFSRFGSAVQMRVVDPIRRQFGEVTEVGVANLHQHRFSGRELVILTTAFALTVTAIGLIASVGVDHSHVLVSLFGPMPEAGKNICLDYNCYKSSALMQSRMNTSYSPCDNFYKYACGGWEASQILSADEQERTVLKVMMQENVQRLRDVILEPIDFYRDTTWAYEKKVQTYYKTCIDQFQSTLWSVVANPLLDEIHAMDGWYVDGDYAHFNFTWAHANILGHDNLIDVFFYYDIEPLDQQHQSHFITLSEDFLLPLPYDRWSLSELVSDYRQFIRKVGEMLAKDDFVRDSQLNMRLDNFVDDVIAIEQQLATIQRSNVIEMAYPRSQVKTIAQLQEALPGFKWLYYLRTCLPEAGPYTINKATQVILRAPKILKATSDLFVSGAFTNRQLNNYLVWRLAYARLPDMPYRYNHLWLDWSEKVRGRSVQYQPIWQVCFLRVVRQMDDAVGGLFTRSHFTHIDKAELHQMVELTRTSVIKEVQKLPWMDEHTKGNATEKLYHVIEKIGFPDHMDTELTMQNVLDFLYQDVTMSESDHFGNSQQLRQHFRKQMVQILTQGRDIYSDWRNTPLYSTKATYFYPWNEMLVPAGVLQFPIYSAVNPTMYRAQTYGATAVMLAKAYIYAIDENGAFFNKFGDFPDDWWTNVTVNRYKPLKDCITKWYSNIKTQPIAYKGEPKPRQLENPDLYAEKAIVEIGALRNAFTAFKSEQVQNDPITQNEKMIPGVKAESRDEYFFLAYAQTKCAVRSEERIASTMDRSDWLPEELAINNALSQVSEFADVFRCPVGSPMNPPNRCSTIF